MSGRVDRACPALMNAGPRSTSRPRTLGLGNWPGEDPSIVETTSPNPRQSEKGRSAPGSATDVGSTAVDGPRRSGDGRRVVLQQSSGFDEVTELLRHGSGPKSLPSKRTASPLRSDDN